MSEQFYKFLTKDLRSPTWKMLWRLGEWSEVKGNIVPCENGLHAATASSLVPFMNHSLYRVEVDGDRQWHGDTYNRKIVVPRMRIVDLITAWNERTARLFAVDCATRVLPNYERAYPNDMRVRDCIETARRFAIGEATRDELDRAAYTAARAYANAAAYTAARAYANAAAYTAAAARDVAAADARDTANAARDGDRAARAEESWQSDRLRSMLDL